MKAMKTFLASFLIASLLFTAAPKKSEAFVGMWMTSQASGLKLWGNIILGAIGLGVLIDGFHSSSYVQQCTPDNPCAVGSCNSSTSTDPNCQGTVGQGLIGSGTVYSSSGTAVESKANWLQIFIGLALLGDDATPRIDLLSPNDEMAKAAKLTPAERKAMVEEIGDINLIVNDVASRSIAHEKTLSGSQAEKAAAVKEYAHDIFLAEATAKTGDRQNLSDLAISAAQKDAALFASMMH
jgi:hypothetical protein